MMKDQKTIDTLISTEEKKLEKLETKKVEIDKKIKATKGTIEKYTLMKNNQQFNALSNSLNGKGISVEDIMAALSAGDLMSLQNKLENVEK